MFGRERHHGDMNDPDTAALTDQLIGAATELTEFLRSFGEDGWADWVDRDVARIRAGDRYGIDHLLTAFGGMGSLSDLLIHPVNGYDVQMADAPRKQTANRPQGTNCGTGEVNSAQTRSLVKCRSIGVVRSRDRTGAQLVIGAGSRPTVTPYAELFRETAGLSRFHRRGRHHRTRSRP